MDCTSGLAPVLADVPAPEDPYPKSPVPSRILFHKDLWILEDPKSPLLKGTRRPSLLVLTYLLECTQPLALQYVTTTDMVTGLRQIL